MYDCWMSNNDNGMVWCLRGRRTREVGEKETYERRNYVAITLKQYRRQFVEELTMQILEEKRIRYIESNIV